MNVYCRCGSVDKQNYLLVTDFGLDRIEYLYFILSEACGDARTGELQRR